MNVAITGETTAGPDAKPPNGRLALRLVLFAIFLGIVAVGMTHHEFFRDEVRPLTNALSADHVWTVPAAIRGVDIHPALWYVLLRLAPDLFGVNEVLPPL